MPMPNLRKQIKSRRQTERNVWVTPTQYERASVTPALDSVRPALDRVRQALDRVNVTPTLDRVNVTPASDRVNVTSALDRVRPASDRVNVTPASDRVNVTPILDRVTVTPALDRVNVTPALDRVNVRPALDRINVTPALDRVNGTPVLDRVDVTPALARFNVRRALDRVNARLRALDRPPFVADIIRPAPLYQERAEARVTRTLSAYGRLPPIQKLEAPKKPTKLSRIPVLVATRLINPPKFGRAQAAPNVSEMPTRRLSRLAHDVASGDRNNNSNAVVDPSCVADSRPADLVPEDKQQQRARYVAMVDMYVRDTQEAKEMDERKINGYGKGKGRCSRNEKPVG